jgi:hypothetical protein
MPVLFNTRPDHPPTVSPSHGVVVGLPHPADDFGGRITCSVPDGNRKKDAVALLNQRLGEIGTGRFVGPDAERLTFDELATILTDEYVANGRKSLDRAQLSIKHLRGHFGQARALDISTDKMTRYIRERQDGGAANATIVRELAALRRCSISPGEQGS